MNSNNRFTKDIGWKLLSLAIAIGLWFTVINTEKPLETRSYTATIQLQNQQSLFDRGYVVVNDDEITSSKITVRLRGQRLALDTLSQSSTKVQAIVDLDNVIYSYSGKPVTVPVNIVIPSIVNNSFEILSKSVQTVSVDIQPYVNEDFEVTPVVDCKDEAVQELVNAVASPGTVTVYGAKSIVNSIAEVRAEVYPEKLESDTVITAIPTAYDENGMPVTKVSFSSKELSVKISMDDLKQAKFAADMTGRPAEGYEAVDVTILPEIIDVAGKNGRPVQGEIIRLPDVDITGVAEDVSVEYNISEFLPDGLRVAGGVAAPQTVKVTVNIEPQVERSITIPASAVTDNGTLSEGRFAHMEAEKIQVTIKGAASVIEAVKPADIVGWVDLTGFEEGFYENVEIKFDLPDGVYISGEPVTADITVS